MRNLRLINLLGFMFICLFSNGQNTYFPVSKFDFNTDMVNAVAFSHDGKLIASASKDKTVTVVNIETEQIILIQKDHGINVKFVDFSMNDKYLLSASENIIIITDLEKNTSIIKTLYEVISDMSAGFNENEIWLVGRNIGLRISSGNNVEPKRLWKFNFIEDTYSAIDKIPRDFELSENGQTIYLAYGSKLEEYDVNTGKFIKSFDVRGLGPVQALDVDSDNNYLLAATGRFSEIRAFHLATGKFIPYKAIAVLPTNIVATNNYFIVADGNKLIFKEYFSINDHRITTGLSNITDFELSSDERFVAVSTESSTINIWKNPIYSEGSSNPPAAKNEIISSDGNDINKPVKSDTDKKETSALETVITDPDKVTDEYIQKIYKKEIDEELTLVPEMFLPRGEFEKSADYAIRLDEQKKLKQSTISFYKMKYIEELNFKKRQESLDIARKEQLFKSKIIASYQQIILNFDSIGKYDPDAEYFPITIEGKLYTANVPIENAKNLKTNINNAQIIGDRQLKMDGVTLDIFNIKIIDPITRSIYPVGIQRDPLYVVVKEIEIPKEEAIETEPPAEEVSSNTDGLDDYFLSELRKKDYYALLIGIEDYDDDNLDLSNPVSDAESLGEVLNNKYTFDQDKTLVLKNPSRSQIIHAFDDLAEKVKEEDELLIFYAGHGYWDEKLGQGYWLPKDATLDYKSEWLSNGTIRDYIRGIKSKHTLLIADACFSGGIFRTRSIKFRAKAELELYKLPSRKAMTSGNLATVPDKSVFMHYLIKRLNDNDNQVLTSGNLFSLFRDAVISNSPNGQVPQFGEIRESGDEGGDFLFVQKKN